MPDGPRDPVPTITERQLAEQWPDMGFDPNSDEPVTWAHDPANVHTTPRMQRAQEVADRLNAGAETREWMQRYRQVLADHVNPQITPARILGIPSEPTDTYGYEVGRVSTPESATACWADDWSGSGRWGSTECGRLADPNSALGLCAEHEADKQRFNEERGPEPAEPAGPAIDFLDDLSLTARGERIYVARGDSNAITVDSLVVLCGGTLDLDVVRPGPDVQPFLSAMALVGQVVTDAINTAAEQIASLVTESIWPAMTRTFGQLSNALIRTDSWMEGPGYAEHYRTGHRWRDPETREQWRVAGRPGDRHWIRTGPRRARWWK